MSFEQKRWPLPQYSTLALVCLIGASVPAFAQERTKPMTDKWRPKDGIYAAPDKDFIRQCRDSADVIVSLGEKTISGNEWSCSVTRLTDTAPGAIRLDMTCYDYNLAQSINEKDDRKFKETMLLQRMDQKSMSVRKTLNGKFKGPDWRAAYCPEDAQRAFTEASAHNQAEAEQKAAEEKLRLHPWRPLEGIYTTSGANFDDQCRKGGDATIALSERSIVSGADKCNVTFIRNEPDAIKLFATCNQAPANPETIVLKKVDDKTVFIQKSTNGNFADAGKQLSYCGQDAQKKAAK